MTYNEELSSFKYFKRSAKKVLNETTCDWDCSNSSHIVEEI